MWLRTFYSAKATVSRDTREEKHKHFVAFVIRQTGFGSTSTIGCIPLSDSSRTFGTHRTHRKSHATDMESPSYQSESEYNQSPEYLQRKLYFLIEQLKIMHAELPE